MVWNSRRLNIQRCWHGVLGQYTIIKAGAVLDMALRNHLETVYCNRGGGLRSLTWRQGETHASGWGTI